MKQSKIVARCLKNKGIWLIDKLKIDKSKKC